MASESATAPIEDSVPMVDSEIAVGDDLEFQRKWWRFSNAIWIIFALMVAADLAGVFGRGPLAHASIKASDGSIDLKYERMERFSTPSILHVAFSPEEIHNGKVQLWVSDALVMPLGNQRIIPQPESSVLQEGGILYTFSVTRVPASVEFAMEPASPGIYTLDLRVPEHALVSPRIYVMP